MSRTIFFKRHHKLVTKILEEASVGIVCAVDNPDLIHSYMIYEFLDDLPVIHYIFTKYSYRHLGLARLLLEQVTHPSQVVLYTHRTRGADKLSQYYPKSIYDPYFTILKEELNGN